jgi:hypothetical protein
MSNNREGWVTLEQAAAILTTTTEELRGLARLGSVPKAEAGMVPLVGMVQSYTRFLRERVVTQKTAAEHIGVTLSYVNQLVQEGWIPRKDGGVALDEAYRGYINFLRDETKRKSKIAAESGLKQARQREIELRIAEREMRVIDTDEAIAFVDLMVGTFRAELGGLSARVTRDVSTRRKIEAQVNEVLRRLSEFFNKGSEAIRSRGSVAEADAEAAS